MPGKPYCLKHCDRPTPRRVTCLTAKIKYRQDYTPPAFLVSAASLDISIHDVATTVKTRLELFPNPVAASGQPLWLDGRDITLLSVLLDGQLLAPHDYKVYDRGIEIEGLSKACQIEVTSVCYLDKNTALEGLYLSCGMYCTQCEPEWIPLDWLLSRSSRCNDHIYRAD